MTNPAVTVILPILKFIIKLNYKLLTLDDSYIPYITINVNTVVFDPLVLPLLRRFAAGESPELLAAELTMLWLCTAPYTFVSLFRAFPAADSVPGAFLLRVNFGTVGTAVDVIVFSATLGDLEPTKAAVTLSAAAVAKFISSTAPSTSCCLR